MALLAICLGVALSFAVHLLNSSALDEFGRASASLNGQPDLVLRATDGGGLPESLFARVAQDPALSLAAPVIEGQAQLRDAKGQPFNLRLIGWDALAGAAMNPQLLPSAGAKASGGLTALIDPQLIWLNAAALQRLAPAAREPGQALTLRAASAENGQALSLDLNLAGSVPAPGSPLAVMDIAAAQLLLGRLGRIDRIDLRLHNTGISPQAWLAQQNWPGGISAAPPPDEGARLSELTRAYRVNLSVLSLMALFTGSLLLFSVMSLSVAQRLPQWALLGVLGMTARERATMLLSEALLLGLIGSALGLLLGWGMAQLGLQVLGSQLGLSRSHATLAFEQLPWGAAAAFGALGVLVSLLSAALPALELRRLPVAQVLKGLGSQSARGLPAWLGPSLLILGLGLAMLPPLPRSSGCAEVPLGAYAAMLSLLLGGIACVPQLLHLSMSALAHWPGAGRSALLLLVRERARDQAGEASRALAGVLVSLSLSVSMLVMVGSFRFSLDDWLSRMLPADLYVRASLATGLDGQTAPLPTEFVEAVSASGLSQRLQPQRSDRIQLQGSSERFALMARRIDEARLPLQGDLARPEPPGTGKLGKIAEQDLTPIYISEALRDTLALRPGQRLMLLQPGGLSENAAVGTPGAEQKPGLPAYVRGVWRDYARQSGAVLMPMDAYQRWRGDTRITELLIWLPEGQAAGPAIRRLRAMAAQPQDIEIAESADLREMSMKIFDRSFAVTVWLQAVTLAIGLFGIAAAQSAQMLARKREFGLLLHLGFCRADVLRLLLLEAGLLCAVGALAGLSLGLGLSAVLVWVLNPQSFHWSMDMHIPVARLAALAGAMWLASVAAAWLAGRRAASDAAVHAVKEDW
ncbi:ABC transporter permease [Paucibacter sp. KCTC 42545]|uniref:ABC transporter permease n=1 Tax=Paucibacter sp. KCTC 42545 TaxID=1768242 RepID=UPI0012E39B42|nr:ABC transporter permease [Paucibacter sp. KCTC 42545]